MQSPGTCVVLVNYRGASDTAACVRSLLASTIPVAIVIVDSTPNDPGLQAAISFASDIKLIRAKQNLGFGGANNLGIKWSLDRSDCEFIFLLNNDTTVFPDTIQLLIKGLEQNPDIGIVTPRIAYMHDPGLLWYGGGEIDWRRASAVTPGFNQSVEAQLALTERDVSFASGCALFFRSSALGKLRGFDSRFFMYEEDLELCLRARETAIRIRYMPKSVVLHRGQGSDNGAAPGRQNLWSIENERLPFFAFHIIRNRLLNIYLHARGKNLVIAAIFFPMFVVRRMLPCILAGRIDAVSAIFRGMRDFWITRRSLPAKN
jgi:GT2 family glycosyltransferase